MGIKIGEIKMKYLDQIMQFTASKNCIKIDPMNGMINLLISNKSRKKIKKKMNTIIDAPYTGL